MSNAESAWKGCETMSRYPALKLFALILLPLLLVACGAPRTNNYTLSFNPMAGGSAALPKSQVGVAAPRASHLLRQDRIVYFTGDNQVNSYHYHRWAEPPVFMLQSLLIRQLRSAGLFDDIVPFRAQKGLDYVLQGRLLAMEEVDTADAVRARFALELELVRQKDDHVVWTARQTCERPVATKAVPAVVEAMSSCVQESLDALTRSLREAAPELERAALEEKGKS